MKIAALLLAISGALAFGGTVVVTIKTTGNNLEVAPNPTGPWVAYDIKRTILSITNPVTTRYWRGIGTNGVTVSIAVTNIYPK